MTKETTNINWNYTGKADYLLGNGATLAEQSLVWAAGLAGIGLYVYFYLSHTFAWSWWQYMVGGLIAGDVIAGIVANSLNSCKRFYHAPVKPGESRFARNHLAFSALHVYPLLVSVLFDRSNILYGLFWYIFLMAGTVIILQTPLYSRRPTSFFIIALALMINIYFLSPIQGFEWLAPGLLLKILYGHLVQEEPYRPVAEESHE